MTFQEAINIIDRYDVNFIYGDGEPIPAEQIAEAMAMAVRSLTAWDRLTNSVMDIVSDIVHMEEEQNDEHLAEVDKEVENE